MRAGPFSIAPASLKALLVSLRLLVTGTVLRCLEEERDRASLWGPFALAFGVALYFIPKQEPPVIMGPVLTAFALLLALSWGRVASLRRLLLWGVAITGAGFTLAAGHAHYAAAPVLERAGYFTLEGQVDRIEIRPARPRVLIRIDEIERLSKDQTPANVRITVSNAQGQALTLGDRVSLRAFLRPPQGPSYPGGFDFRRWAWFEQLGATGYAVGPLTIREAGAQQDSADNTAGTLLKHARSFAASRLRAHLEGQTAAIAIALTVGDRSGLDRETTEAMRDSGLAHLLAISGLHIGLVASTIFFLIRAVLVVVGGPKLGASAKKISAFFALLGAFAYLLLSGAPPPTQRAFVMTGLVLVAVIFDRRAISMRLVALAVCVVVLWRPESVIGASFQLSFAAVIGLVAAYEAFGNRLQIAKESTPLGATGTPLLQYGLGVVTTTVIASVATAPFVLHHFGRLAVYGVAANLFAVPIVAFFVMPAGLMGLLLIPLGIEGPAILVMGFGIDAVLQVAHFFAKLEGSHITLPTSPGWALFLTIVGGLWCAIWQGYWRRLGAIPLCLGLASGFLFSERPILFIEGEKGAFLYRDDATNQAYFHAGDSPDTRSTRFDPIGFLPSQWSRPIGIGPGEIRSAGDSNTPQCDDLGCIFRLENGRTIAISYDLRSATSDCRLADIVLVPHAPLPRSLCDEADITKSFFDFRRDGSYALWPGRSARLEPAISYGRLWSAERN